MPRILSSTYFEERLKRMAETAEVFPNLARSTLLVFSRTVDHLRVGAYDEPNNL